jgi:hypothetical protein
MPQHRLPPFIAVVFTFAALLLSGCAVRPKSVPCSNAGDCQTAGDRFHYCTESRCVECLDDTSCSPGNRCTDGMCERRCRDDSDCSKGERCNDRICGV